MKTKIPILGLVFCLSLFSTFSNAQGVWDLQNPLPTPDVLRDIFCIPNSTKAWAVGDKGTIVKTVDGNTWTKVNSGITESLSCIYFYDDNFGWAGGDNGKILKTTNGGNSWTNQNIAPSYFILDIYFRDKLTGWAVGDSSGLAHKTAILKTIDGGTTWTKTFLVGYELYTIFFVDANTGWASGWNGAIFKSTDGGKNWSPQTSGTTNWIWDISFIDANTGWLVGMGGTILKTTNGGINWVPQTSGTTNSLYCTHFIDVNTGWVVGQLGTILKTTNGGSNWIPQTSGTQSYLNAVRFSDANTGWAVGDNGALIRSTDGGSNWTSLTQGPLMELRKVKFIDKNIGFATGGLSGNSTSGIFIKTINGGVIWSTLLSGYTYGFNSLSFFDANTGWIAGFNGTILKTTNGGINWFAQTSGTTNTLRDISFINSNIGWAVGDGGTILKTINGGTNWTPQSSGVTFGLFKSCFIDANTGWAVGYSKLILKTTNGGTTWTTQNPGINVFFYGVFFINANTGWVVGGSNITGDIAKTTNGGTSWTTQTSNSTDELLDVNFVDQYYGTAACARGTIINTSNGGSTWTNQLSGTAVILNGVSMVDSNTGWVVGAGGCILKYTNYSPTTQASNISISGTTYQSINVSWTRGNGNQSALFAKQTNTGNCTPDVNVTYLPNATFGLGDQIGSTGWYCVYNGSGTSASISGLQANTAYRFQACEYNFSPDFTHYNINTASNNPITATTAIAPPQITGNPSDKTLCEPLNTTFSVTASGSGLGYQWQADAGSGYLNVNNGGIYSGCTTSTLSLTGIPASLNGYKYQCVVTNTSGSATSSGALLTVNPLPVAPSDISGTQVVCLNSSYPYTVPPVQYATSYAWTYPAGFSGTSTTNNINLTTSSGAVAGNITVKGLNGCGAGPVKSFPVSVRNLPANASQITGLNSVCTGSLNIGYNTAAISDADYYVWSVPLGATGTSATNSIMISYGNNPVTDQITIRGHNICGDGVQSVLPVSVNTVPEAIGTISGSSNLCKNQKDVPFSINAIPNAVSYTWTLPQGIAGSNSTNSVSLNIGPDAFSGDVKVSGVNSCGTGAEIVFPVIVDAAPDPSGTITGPAKVCRGETNVQYSVPKSDKATSYTWSLPDGTSETTIANKIALNFDNSTLSGNLSVSPANSCGSGDSKSLFIDVTVPSKPEITSDNYQAGSCLGETPMKLSVKEALPGYNYLWYKNGASISPAASSYLEGYLSSGDYTVEADLDGCTSQSEIFKLLFSEAPEKPVIYSKGPTVWYLACSNENAQHYKWYYNGSIIPEANNYVYVAAQKLGKYYVLVGNANNCFTASDEITIPPLITGINDIDLNSGIKIYPNPTTGKLTIEMNNRLYGDLMINVLNQEGKVLSTKKIKKTTEELLDQIDLSSLSKGIYYIHLTINDFNSSQKIIIE